MLNEFHAGRRREVQDSLAGRRSSSLSGATLSSQSLPTVPSLPSISRTGGSRPGSSFGQAPSQPGISTSGGASGMVVPGDLRGGGGGSVASSRGGALAYALVGVLVVAIAVLAILLLNN